MKWLDSIPLTPLVLISLMLGLAPFFPEPHLFEKVRMLFNGSLSKPIDIFDLLMHGAPVVILSIKLIREAQKKGE
ncbi:MAG: RND transporter [Gammaproteobacteria bacterium]|nr:RND transporter [Gammaproteobacteria bacterium]